MKINYILQDEFYSGNMVGTEGILNLALAFPFHHVILELVRCSHNAMEILVMPYTLLNRI